LSRCDIANPELKALKDVERDFVHGIVHKGLEKVESYCLNYDKKLTEANKQQMRQKALTCFYKPNVNRYYHALMEEVRDSETKKGVWTKDVSTKKLMRLLEKAEEDIYGDEEKGVEGKQLTMSRLNAIILSAKELNLMHGYNQTNMNVDGVMVQIVGEGDLED